MPACCYAFAADMLLLLLLLSHRLSPFWLKLAAMSSMSMVELQAKRLEIVAVRTNSNTTQTTAQQKQLVVAVLDNSNTTQTQHKQQQTETTETTCVNYSLQTVTGSSTMESDDDDNWGQWTPAGRIRPSTSHSAAAADPTTDEHAAAEWEAAALAEVAEYEAAAAADAADEAAAFASSAASAAAASYSAASASAAGDEMDVDGDAVEVVSVVVAGAGGGGGAGVAGVAAASGAAGGAGGAIPPPQQHLAGRPGRGGGGAGGGGGVIPPHCNHACTDTSHYGPPAKCCRGGGISRPNHKWHRCVRCTVNWHLQQQWEQVYQHRW